MDFCFRVRCTLSATVYIASEESQWTLATSDDDGEVVVLTSADGDGRPLSRARDVVVRGSSYESEDAAAAAGERWLSRVRAAFARTGLGADFGGRGAGDWWYDAGLRMLENEHGGRMLNDVAGLSVFECEPPPSFARVDPPTLAVGRAGADVLNALRTSTATDAAMTPRQKLAYEIYSASLDEADVEARFVMLTMALEALLPDQPRPPAVLALVEQFVRTADQAVELDQADRASLIGSLKHLGRQSVGQVGRQLAQSLGDRHYMEGEPGQRRETAAQFFTNAYTMRSNLVHGHEPRPTRDEVSVRGAHLTVFVADILAAQSYDVAPQPGEAT